MLGFNKEFSIFFSFKKRPLIIFRVRLFKKPSTRLSYC